MAARRSTQEELDSASAPDIVIDPSRGPDLSLAPHPSTPEELRTALPIDIVNEQGVTNWERLAFKLLSNNPSVAKRWFEDQGYEVQEYGGEFAVRTAPDQPFRPIDPEGPDLNDFLIDILPALGVGALTELGRVMGGALGGVGGAPAGPPGVLGGGILGQAAGAGLTGAVEDVALQGLGMAVGINEEIDPVQTAMVGGVSAVLPVAGRHVARGLKAAGKSGLVQDMSKATVRALKKTGMGAQDILAKFSGFVDDFNLGAGESLARTSRRGSTPAPSIKDASDITREVIGRPGRGGLRGRKFGETVALEKLFDDAGQAGKTIDVVDEISAVIGISPSSAATNDGARLIKNIRNEILSIVDLSNGAPIPRSLTETIATAGPLGEASARALPEVLVSPADALQLKRLFGDIAAEAGLFRATLLPKTKKQAQVKTLKAFGTIRAKLKAALSGPDAERFEVLNGKIEEKLDAISGLERALGKGIDEADDSIALGEKMKPEAFFGGLFGETSQTQLAAVRKFDRVFEKDLEELFVAASRGTPAERLFAKEHLSSTIEDLAREARSGSPFRGGDPGLIPPLGATGAAKGIEAMKSLVPFAAGMAFGGPVGGTVGLAFASPKILSGLRRGAISTAGATTRATLKTMDKLGKTMAIQSLPPAMRSAAFALFQQQTKRLLPDESKPVIRQDKSAMRKELEGR